MLLLADGEARACAVGRRDIRDAHNAKPGRITAHTGTSTSRPTVAGLLLASLAVDILRTGATRRQADADRRAEGEATR
jgi:hypothetical protein